MTVIYRNVFLFKPGNVPADAHTLLLSQIAAHGIVVVGVWKISNPSESFQHEWFDATVDFVENRLENSLHNQEGIFKCLLICYAISHSKLLMILGYDPDFHIDYLHSFIGGHSAGSHVAVTQLQVKFQWQINYRSIINKTS